MNVSLPRSLPFAGHLCAQARELIAQRDDLAEAMERVGGLDWGIGAVLLAGWELWGQRVEAHCSSCRHCLQAEQELLP
jgi:hypothetical protein